MTYNDMTIEEMLQALESEMNAVGQLDEPRNAQSAYQHSIAAELDIESCLDFLQPEAECNFGGNEFTW